MEQLTEDIKIILNNVQKDNIITLSDNLISYIVQELKKLKYEKIPDNASIWTDLEQISACRSAALLESRKICKALFLFMLQNKLINSQAAEKIVDFMLVNFGIGLQ